MIKVGYLKDSYVSMHFDLGDDKDRPGKDVKVYYSRDEKGIEKIVHSPLKPYQKILAHIISIGQHKVVGFYG